MENQIELSELRVNKKMSQRKLARELGFSPTLISQLESGNRKPSLSTAITIAQYFELPVESISFENMSLKKVGE